VRELFLMFTKTIGKARIKPADSGHVYDQRDMNNRANTVQKQTLLVRHEGD